MERVMKRLEKEVDAEMPMRSEKGQNENRDKLDQIDRDGQNCWNSQKGRKRPTTVTELAMDTATIQDLWDSYGLISNIMVHTFFLGTMTPELTFLPAIHNNVPMCWHSWDTFPQFASSDYQRYIQGSPRRLGCRVYKHSPMLQKLQ